ASATELKTHVRFRTESPRAGLSLVGVRYLMRKEPLGSQAPVFADEHWKIYELPEFCPRAWLVHRVTVEPSLDRVIARISALRFRPRDEARIADPLDAALPPGAVGMDEDASVTRYEPNRIEVTARARAAGLLVVGEVFYPGWRASVNGVAARIHQVD